MRYVSTRGGVAPASFEEVLLAGLAPDGGLFVPETWPQISIEELRKLQGRPYTDVAARIIAPFIGDAVASADLAAMLRESYTSFENALVAPLAQCGPSSFLLELFHGPTLAFKDVALQLLGRLFAQAIGKRGNRLTIVGATSGDTGSAAIEAIAGRGGMNIVILHPEGRVSDVQRRQMTTSPAANVHNIAVAGTFDDCQRIVKELFADHAFAREAGLSGINSINWARIMAQAVYYVTAGLALGILDRPVSFAVPTGNFGDIYAGYVALRMGLPIRRLVIATNENDILARVLKSGRYEVKGVKPTSSPSMDIELSSNFERLVFEATGRDGAATAALFGSLAQSGSFSLPTKALSEIAARFVAERASEEEVAAVMRRAYQEGGRLIDPHTAVAMVVHDKLRAAHEIEPGETAVILSTAHPAKFPDAVERATGIRPALPARLADLGSRPERLTKAPPDAARVKALIRSQVLKS